MRARTLRGALVALARVSGRSAPLWFAALHGQHPGVLRADLSANIPMVTFQFALNPDRNRRSMTSAGGFLSLISVVVTRVFARLLVESGKKI